MPPRFTPPLTDPTPQRAALLVEDPDLALGVPEDERDRAERAVLVTLIEAEPGPLALDDDHDGPTLGILVLDGFVRARTTFAGQSTAQLLGPGHIVQAGGPDDGLLPVAFTHDALTSVRLAVLDRRFIAAVRRWPGLLIALHERLRLQQRQLAVHAAIGRLRRNEDRILAVLWQVAEQWGRVTSEGVTVPLKLTHEAIGHVAGASRPTTSLALAALEAEGRLRRAAGSQLVLHPDSSMIRKRIVSSPPRRPTHAAETGVVLSGIDRSGLLARVAALQAGFDDQVRNSDEILAASRAAAARSAETRRLTRASRARQ